MFRAEGRVCAEALKWEKARGIEEPKEAQVAGTWRRKEIVVESEAAIQGQGQTPSSLMKDSGHYPKSIGKEGNDMIRFAFWKVISPDT